MEMISTEIRPETLTPANIWTPPTNNEVRLMVALYEKNVGKKLTTAEIGSVLGLGESKAGSGGGSRTFRRWIRQTTKEGVECGNAPSVIPYCAWAILAYKAGLGMICDDPICNDPAEESTPS